VYAVCGVYHASTLIAASQRRCMINIIYSIHSKIPPDDE